MIQDPPQAPLILTALFDAASASVFQTLRDRHFPPGLNIVPAHLTLFHNLPGSERVAIERELARACALEQPISFSTGKPRSLGRGVALPIEAERLPRLRKEFAAIWDAWLVPQDRQGFRPHVTVQNKVAPAEARALLEWLSATLAPIHGTIVGLALWHYRNGPWELAGRFAFGEEPASGRDDPRSVRALAAPDPRSGS